MMTKKQKITIASVAGACVIVLAAAIICIVLFLGGGEGNDTQPASVSTVSSLEAVPAQSEETSQAAQETSSVATESQPDAQAEQPGQGEEGTTPQQTAQTTSQSTTPAATTSTPAAPTASAPAATTPSTPTQPSIPSQPAQPSQPSLEDQIAEFNTRAPQIIQLAYQKLEAEGITPSPNSVDPNTHCWIGTSAECGWQEWAFNIDWDNEQCANEIVEVIKLHEISDGLPIYNAQIVYLGINTGIYSDNQARFRFYIW